MKKYSLKNINKSLLKQIIKDIESKKYTKVELSNKYNISQSSLYKIAKQNNLSFVYNSRKSKKIDSITLDRIKEDILNMIPQEKIAQKYDICVRTVRNIAKRFNLPKRSGSLNNNRKFQGDIPLEKLVIDYVKKNKNVLLNIYKIAESFNVNKEDILGILKRAQIDGLILTINEDNMTVTCNDSAIIGGSSIIPAKFATSKSLHNVTYTFGLISDTHMGSLYERLDVLEQAYDTFAARGVKTVLHLGNPIDGERATVNYGELHTYGMENQVIYFIKNLPMRKGITTEFITGECHEGWYMRKNIINIGEYIESMAKKMGRQDIKFLSHIEHDKILPSLKGKAIMKLMHPGGGSAYAVSYRPQKIIESFQDGEKPHILLLGHYHKSLKVEIRGVVTILVPSCQDQTPFMRRHSITSVVGFSILNVTLDEFGGVSNVVYEEEIKFNRKYYVNGWKFKFPHIPGKYGNDPEDIKN